MNKEELKYKYFTEGLSDTEDLLLKQYLAEDTDFNESFQFEKQLQSTLIKSERQTIKERLISLEKEEESHTGPRPSRYYNLRIAASLVLFFAVGWLAYTLLFGIDEDQLYAQNFEAYPNVIQSFERGEGKDEDLASQSLRYYEQGDYKSASEYFLKLNEETSDLYVDFYLAQTYLSLKKYKEAKSLLVFLVREKTGFYSESLWYLALTELKLNHIKEAKKLLETLVQEGNYKVTQAKNLLELLD